MKKILILASVLAIVFSCTTMDYEVQPENDLATQSVADRNFYGFSPDQMEMITLPSGITVGKVDDMYIYDDDIILSAEQLELLSQPQTRGNIDVDVWSGGIKAWPGAVIYYTIPANCPGPLATTIMAAIDEFHNKSFIRFVPRTNQANYVYFYTLAPDEAVINGSSHIGMVGGAQNLYLYSGTSKAVVLHELAHAAGLLHEFNRIDRDEYLNLDGQLVTSEVVQKYGIPHGPFNFNSITMYAGFNRRDGLGQTIAVDKLSYGDVVALNAAYGYPEFMQYTEPTISFTINNGILYKYLTPDTPYTFDMMFSDPDLRLPDHQGLYDVTIRQLNVSVEPEWDWSDGEREDVTNGLSVEGQPPLQAPILWHYVTPDNFIHVFPTAGYYSMTVVFGGMTRTFGINVRDNIVVPRNVYAQIYIPGPLERVPNGVPVYFYSNQLCTQRINPLPMSLTLRYDIVRSEFVGGFYTEVVESSHAIQVQAGASSAVLPHLLSSQISPIREYRITGCGWNYLIAIDDKPDITLDSRP